MAGFREAFVQLKQLTARMFVVGFIVMGLLLLVLTATWFIGNLTSVSAPPIKTTKGMLPYEGEPATLILQYQESIPKGRLLPVVASVEMRKSTIQQIWDSNQKDYVTTRDEIPRLKQKYDWIQLRIIVVDEDTGSIVSVPLPLSQFFDAETGEFAGLPMRVPIGQIVEIPFFADRPAQLFPRDSYRVRAYVDLRLPDGFLLRNSPEFGGLIPLELKVGAAPGILTGLVASLRFEQVGDMGQMQKPDGTTIIQRSRENVVTVRRLNFWIERDGRTQMFVYTILSIPFALALMVGHLLFIHPEHRKRSVSETMLGMAVVLAILPLRLILVPSGVPGPTLVDLILGLEVALIASIVFVRYGVELARAPSSSS